MPRSEDEGQELQGQGVQGQGVHLSGQERSRQGYHFRETKMKSQPRRQLSEAERSLIASASRNPRYHLQRQAAPAPAPGPAPAPAPVETTKGSSESIRVREILPAADGHQSDQNTDAATRESDATQTNEPQNIQPIDTPAAELPDQMTEDEIKDGVTSECNAVESEDSPSRPV
ncbi:hypothetical protein EMPG_14095 [Blastomyces silverae]|uniref:Uncharacterized protein n=1 Tax=Blastomyces silverae TaxID=2060906 RepID=A0A0H1BGR0_9EURO|nr:hypothetical protein EMPG_14095 [Blastomyces silverae]